MIRIWFKECLKYKLAMIKIWLNVGQKYYFMLIKNVVKGWFKTSGQICFCKILSGHSQLFNKTCDWPWSAYPLYKGVGIGIYVAETSFLMLHTTA